MGLDSIFGNFGQAVNLKGQAAVSRANARAARARGEAARGQAYGQAARIETSNRVAGEKAAENMQRVQRSGSLARGEVRAVRGASGFNSQGSGQQAEVSVLERYEQVAQDMAQSRSLQDMDARFAASMSRKSGDIAGMGAEADYQYGMAQAGMQQQMASNARHAGIAQIIGMVGGGVVGGLTGAGVLAGANRGSGLVSMLQSGVPGAYESGHATVTGDLFSKFMADKLSTWMS